MTSALDPTFKYLPRVPALASPWDGLQPESQINPLTIFQVDFDQCLITTTKSKLRQQGTNWIYRFRASCQDRGGYHNFMTQFPLSHQTLNEALAKANTHNLFNGAILIEVRNEYKLSHQFMPSSFFCP